MSERDVAQPSAAQVRLLPMVAEGAVRDDQIDHNQHLNVREYFSMLVTATTVACGAFRLDLSYPVESGMGLFAVGHHAQYLGELRLGDRYTGHVRLVEATDKAVHTIAYLVDAERDRLSCALETVFLNVDIDSRRVVGFAEDRRMRLAKGLAFARSLDWTPVVCGSMRVPGRSLADLPA